MKTKIPAPGKGRAKDAGQPELSALVPSPQQIIRRLEALAAQLDSLPLPKGQEGCQLLDALELVDQIRERIRAKARKLLSDSPKAIPHWRAETSTVRRLQRNAQSIWEAVQDYDGDMSVEHFLEACSISLEGLLSLAREVKPGYLPGIVESEIEEVLDDAELIRREPVTRLIRDDKSQGRFLPNRKGGQP